MRRLFLGVLLAGCLFAQTPVINGWGSGGLTAVNNDTNVTGSVSGTTFTLGWTGALAKTRLPTTTVFSDQANTISGAMTLTGSAATGSNNLVTVQDSASNTGTGYVFTAAAAAGSAAKAFQVLSGGSQVVAASGSGLVMGNGFPITAVSGLRLGGIQSKTAAYTAANTDFFIKCDTTAGAYNITLAANPPGSQVLVIKKIDSSANACTIAGNGKTIDGATSQTLSTQYQSLQLQYDGTQWWILSKN